MDKGFVIDSVHDRWYDQFTAAGRGPRLPDDFLNCPTQGSPGAPRQFLGFRYVRNDTWWPLAQLPFNYPKAESTALYVPHWSLALLCALLPTAWLLRAHRARSSHHRGLCPTCAYDLRATPNQCPECGAKSDARAAATTAQPLPR